MTRSTHSAADPGATGPAASDSTNHREEALSMNHRNVTKRTGALLALAGTALTAGAMIAGPAVAHTPSVDAGCTQAASYLTVTLRDYNPGGTNTVRVTLDGQSVANATFGASYTFTRDTLTSDEPHAYRVVVDAWDDPGGQGFDLDQAGTIEPCVTPTPSPTVPSPTPTTPEPTTPPPTTPAPTTPPVTTPPTTTGPPSSPPSSTTPPATTPPTVPPAQGSEDHDCRSITVTAPDAGAQVIVSIGDQDREVRLVDGVGTLTFPPHIGPLNVVVTITAPGRETTVLRVPIPACVDQPVPPTKPTPTPTVTTPAATPPPVVAPPVKPAPTTATVAPRRPAAVPSVAATAPTDVQVIRPPAQLAYTGASTARTVWLGVFLLVLGVALLFLPGQLAKRNAR